MERRYFGFYLLLTLLFVFFNIINFAALVPILEVLFNEVEIPTVGTETSSFGLSYWKNSFYSCLYGVISTNGKKTALVYVCLIVLGSVFLANLFRYLADLCLVELRLSIVYNLRKNIFDILLNMPLAYLSRQKKGDLIARAMNDVQEVETSVIYTLKVYLKEPILILGFLAILFSMSASLALYSLILIPVSGLIISEISRKLKSKAVETQNVVGEIGFILDQMLSGIREIKSYGAQTFISNQFDRKNKDYANFNRSMGNKFQLAGPVSEVLGVATMVIILIIGGSIVLGNSGELNASQFIAFLIIFSQVLAPVKALSQAHSLMQRGMGSAKRIFEIIDVADTVIQKPSDQRLHYFDNRIEFKDVSFSYDKTVVLNKIDLIFEKGKTYALAGPSGAGKSTLVDLLCRFHDPTVGSVLLDEVDLRLYDLSDLRHLIAAVSQDTVLFNDTVRNNIVLGLPDISEERVVEVAKMANAYGFIKSLPQGYDTIIGERGSKLSGGERQRIAIARAVLKNAPILILDEATSALDQDSEDLVREALARLMKGKTTIIITHRLNSIENSDQIIRMENGRIIFQESSSFSTKQLTKT